MELIYIMFCHWFADFCLQTEEQAKNKSGNFKKLTEHTFWYSVSMMVFSLLVLNQQQALLLFTSCFIFHTMTDYVSSKLSKRQYLAGRMNGLTGFWSIVGFDQFLHFVQIYITYLLITGGSLWA